MNILTPFYLDWEFVENIPFLVIGYDDFRFSLADALSDYQIQNIGVWLVRMLEIGLSAYTLLFVRRIVQDIVARWRE